MQVEQFTVFGELVDDAERGLSKLLELVTLALVRLFNDVREKLNEGTLHKLLLEAGRLQHLVEGEHEQLVAAQVLEFALALGKNVADAETGVFAHISGQLAVVLKGLLEVIRTQLNQVWAHLRHRLDHAEQAALDVFEIVSEQLVDIFVQV